LILGKINYFTIDGKHRVIVTGVSSVDPPWHLLLPKTGLIKAEVLGGIGFISQLPFACDRGGIAGILEKNALLAEVVSHDQDNIGTLGRHLLLSVKVGDDRQHTCQDQKQQILEFDHTEWEQKAAPDFPGAAV
jgi:hypothetical protein